MNQIMIHGLGQRTDSWEETISRLTNRYMVSCPELLELARGKEPTYNNLFAGFNAYCDGFSGSVSLCGLSLGAIMALNYAIDHPEKVDSLILIAPQYKIPRLLLQVQNTIFRVMPRTAFHEMGKQETIILTASMMTLDFSEKLKTITCPTLVLCGEKDGANRKACEKTAELIPNGAFKIIANAGHEVNLDAPKALAAAINDFTQLRKQSK